MSWPACVIIAIIAMGAVGYIQKISATLLSPAALLFWVTVAFMVGALALIAYLPAHRFSVTPTLLALGLLCGVTNAIGSWCLFRALHLHAPASIAIPLTALYPLVTVLLAVPLLHEALSLRQSVGAVLAVVGGAVLSYERSSKTGDIA